MPNYPAPHRTWLDVYQENGIEFRLADNIHLLEATLGQHYRLERNRASPGEEIKLAVSRELIGTQGGQKRLYRYYHPVRKIAEFDAIREPLWYHGDWKKVFFGLKRRTTNEIALHLADSIPPPTGHYWRLEEQRAIMVRFMAYPGGRLTDALQEIAEEHQKQGPYENTPVWAVFEYFLQMSSSQVPLAAEGLPTNDAQLRGEQPHRAKAFTHIRSRFPGCLSTGKAGSASQFLNVLVYRVYSLSRPNPMSWTAWNREALPELELFAPGLRAATFAQDRQAHVRAERYFSPSDARAIHQPLNTTSSISPLVRWLSQNGLDQIDVSLFGQGVRTHSSDANGSLKTRRNSAICRSLRKAGQKAEAQLLSLHLLRCKTQRYHHSLQGLDPRWAIVKDKLRSTPQASNHPNVYFVDVEATGIEGGHGGHRLFSASLFTASAKKVDVRSRISYDNPELTNDTDRLDFTVDYGTSIDKAVSGTIASYSKPALRWVWRQYNTPPNRATWGLKEDEIAQRLGEIGLTRASRHRDIIIARSVNDYDRRILAALPNCGDIFPNSIDPSALLSALGWRRNTSLGSAFLAVTMSDEENQEYYQALYKAHHLPWVDNEMARIVVREILEYFE
ncbi:hypothetical protein F4861DRAFT_536433 [Xylaria intraflava]|nr:hypothetical protein F4861DRAFT_536433 [Xylaria intraflava]